MTAGEAGKGATEFLAAVDYLRNALTSCLVGKTAQRVQDQTEMLQASSACRPRHAPAWRTEVRICHAQQTVWHAQSAQHEAVARDCLVLEAMGVEKPPNPNLPHLSLQRAA